MRRVGMLGRMASYVALGDSYSCGMGAGERVNDCYRSVIAYPMLVARGLGVDLSYQACQGAMSTDVLDVQLAALSEETTLVTLTVGGNDIGFTQVLTECAKPAWMGKSDPVIDRALNVVRNELPDKLAKLYAEVITRAPNARFVVAGYPHLFAGEDCNLATFFSEHEMERLGEIADEMAGLTASMAGAVKATFVDVREAFVGHAVCGEPEWLRGVSEPREVSFHPNTAGQAAYGRLILEALGVPEAQWQDREPQVIQGPPSGLGRPEFQLPDLLSKESLEGARHWGLDPREVEILARLAGVDEPMPDTESDERAASERLGQMDADVRQQRS